MYHVLEYLITRTGYGRGDSPYNMSNSEAAGNARMRAQANLIHELDEAIEPIHCPRCKIFQPEMVQLLYKMHWKRYDVNKYASERVTIGPMDALLVAAREKTVASYTKLLETCPHLLFASAYAKNELKLMRYSPYLQWFVSHFWQILYGALILLIIGIVTGLLRYD